MSQVANFRHEEKSLRERTLSTLAVRVLNARCASPRPRKANNAAIFQRSLEPGGTPLDQYEKEDFGGIDELQQTRRFSAPLSFW